MWFKQVHRDDPSGPATWATFLLAEHVTVMRSYNRPNTDQLGPQDMVVG